MKKFKITLAVLFITAMLTPSLFAGETFPDEHVWYIKSALSGKYSMKGCWDVPGSPTSFHNGQNIKVWDLPRSDMKKKDRMFYITRVGNGYCAIRSFLNISKAYIDVDGGRYDNGRNIHLWTRNNGHAQKFRFVHQGNGRFKIFTTSGKVITLDNRSNANGKNVHIWDNQNGPWTEWYMVNAITKKIWMPGTSKPPVKNIPVTLDQAFRAPKVTYKLETYFKKVGFKQLIRENKQKSVHSRLNSLKRQERAKTIVKILSATKDNKDYGCRIHVYSEIFHTNFKKFNKGFTMRLYRKRIKQIVDNSLKTEKNRDVQKFLVNIKDKL